MKRALALLALLAAGCSLPDGSLPPTTYLYGGRAHLVAASHNAVQIVVLARDGAPAATPVHMTLDTSALRLGFRLAATLADSGRDSLTIASDARGLASAVIWTGGLAGHAVIHVSAPAIDLSCDMAFDLPAEPHPRSLSITRIVPIHPGDSTLVTWSATDSAGLAYTEGAPTIDDPAVAALTWRNYLKAYTTGFTWVRLTVGSVSDSAPLAVVPTGVLGAVETDGAFHEFDLTGAGNQYITIANNGFGGPRYSPSGDTLAYHQGGAIYLRLLNGLKPAVVGNGSFGVLAAATQPWWSGDGLWIYFTGYLASTQREIWRVHPDGSGGVRVGPAAAAGQMDGSPSVNPSGALLAMSTTRVTSGGRPTLQVITTSDTALAWQGPAASDPAFSPDGTWIAFLTPGGQLALVHPDGTSLRTALPAMTLFQGPLAWSRDSRYIAVAFGGGTTPQYLHVVDIQTDTDIRLPYAPGYTTPAWR